VGGNGPFHVNWATVPDGRAVWFTTAERLAPEDSDAEEDLYVARPRSP
jgi:hypothetical protein